MSELYEDLYEDLYHKILMIYTTNLAFKKYLFTRFHSVV